jgi:repressor LexA
MNVEDKVRKLRQFLRREGRVPGYGEMLKLFEYRSKNAVFGAIKRMEELGFLKKHRGKITPGPGLRGGLRVLGMVQAGFPSPAEEELADAISLDEFLIRRPEATYMLTVNGDSMTGAGIFPGDMVLVERGNNPKPNDVVVAQVDDEWTIKYYRKDASGVWLEAANARYQPIRPKRTLVVGGIVKAVIRKYD